MYGTTEGSMKGSIRMTRSMDTESTHGLTVDAMKDTGGKENNTGWEPILYLRMRRLSLDYGRMENVLSGLLRLMSTLSTKESWIILLTLIKLKAKKW